MIGFIVFLTTSVVLVIGTIIKDRKDYYDWYNECDHILKR